MLSLRGRANLAARAPFAGVAVGPSGHFSAHGTTQTALPAMALPVGSTRLQAGCRSPALPRLAAPLPRLASQPAARLQAKRQPDGQEPEERRPVQSAAVAALAACLLLGSTVAPLDAEAARSSGRVGGSSGFRSAAPRPAPRAAAPSGPSRG